MKYQLNHNVRLGVGRSRYININPYTMLNTLLVYHDHRHTHFPVYVYVQT